MIGRASADTPEIFVCLSVFLRRIFCAFAREIAKPPSSDLTRWPQPPAVVIKARGMHTEGAMADVLISYSRKDRERCSAIREALSELGVDVWHDA
jgi:hypothetical protein